MKLNPWWAPKCIKFKWVHWVYCVLLFVWTLHFFLILAQINRFLVKVFCFVYFSLSSRSNVFLPELCCSWNQTPIKNRSKSILIVRLQFNGLWFSLFNKFISSFTFLFWPLRWWSTQRYFMKRPFFFSCCHQTSASNTCYVIVFGGKFFFPSFSSFSFKSK